MYDFDSSKNITDSKQIRTVAIFPLGEKFVNNMEQPEEMGHALTDVEQQ